MRRRDLLAAAAIGLVSIPEARAQATRVLRFVPGDTLGALDPVADLRPHVAAAALLVWDTLYGVDSQLQPQPQMCAGHEVSDDRREWTFRLRDGLRFHDGTNVLAADAVASLRRWMARDRMGQAIAARLDSLDALDDSRFRFRLRAPFGPMLFALGKSTPPLAVVMPARLAATDPAVAVAQPIGSGPMRLLPADAWVFERFDGYAIRPEGADWLAGGKRILFERIEWAALSDSEAADALQNDAADWWAAPTAEAAPLLKRNRNVLVDVANPLGLVGTLRFNQRQPPFDDPRARRAVQLGLSQEACMAAATGGDDALWKPMPGVFTPGSPLALQLATTDAPSPPPDLDAARRLLGEAAGARVVVLAASDPDARAHANAVAGQLRRLGLAPDVLALSDAVLAERLAHPDGWHAYASWSDGAAAATPAWDALAVGADGIGWPRQPDLENAVAAWYAATTPDAAALAAAAVGRAARDGVAFVPTGFFQRYQAWRTSLTGIGQAPLPLFWGVRKS